MNARSRFWCFTTNNPSAVDIPREHSRIQFCVYQLERGESGTEHVQGYCVFRDRVRLSTAKNVSWLSRSHLAVRRGTHEQAVTYCEKSESRIDGPFRFGEYTESNARCTESGPKQSRLDTMCRVIREGGSAFDCDDDSTYVRNYRGLRELRIGCVRERMSAYRQLRVLVIWGATDLGKTRFAYHHFPKLYRLCEPHGQLFFDGYDGQECLLIDDFSGWIRYRYLLTMLDGYPIELPVKGSFFPAMYKMVIITSNVPPERWYNREDISPLMRRLHVICHVENAFDFEGVVPEIDEYGCVFYTNAMREPIPVADPQPAASPVVYVDPFPLGVQSPD